MENLDDDDHHHQADELAEKAADAVMIKKRDAHPAMWWKKPLAFSTKAHAQWGTNHKA